MIGNENDARLAYLDWSAGFFDHLFSDNGSSRYVFLINDVLYKVERGGSIGANEQEWINYCILKNANLPAIVSLPEMSCFDIDGHKVIAAEMITGREVGECFDNDLGMECSTPDLCLSPKALEMLRDYSDDLCYGNVIVSDGIYYLVDIA